MPISGNKKYISKNGKISTNISYSEKDGIVEIWQEIISKNGTKNIGPLKFKKGCTLTPTEVENFVECLGEGLTLVFGEETEVEKYD